MESAEVFFGQATHVYRPKRAWHRHCAYLPCAWLPPSAGSRDLPA